MIEIEFGENAGGKRSFRSPDDLMKYIAQQADQWAKHPLAPPSQNRAPQGFARQLSEPWRQLQSQINGSLQQFPENIDRLMRTVGNSEFLRQAVSLESEVGQHISEIARVQTRSEPEGDGGSKAYG